MKVRLISVDFDAARLRAIGRCKASLAFEEKRLGPAKERLDRLVALGETQNHRLAKARSTLVAGAKMHVRVTENEVRSASSSISELEGLNLTLQDEPFGLFGLSVNSMTELGCVGKRTGRPLQCWVFCNRVYVFDGLGVPVDVQQIKVKEAYFAEQQNFDRIRSQALGGSPEARRPLPESVRIEVWNRDGGKCVRCGGRNKLEYDHIIPLKLGGSNTARNIELLCEACNREKSDKIR